MNAVQSDFTRQVKPLSPRSHAVLDAASDRYPAGDRDVKTNFLQYLDAHVEKAFSDIVSSAARMIAQAKARIDAQAQPLDRLSMVSGVQGDAAVHRAGAVQELAPSYQRLALADANNTAYEREEGLTREATPNYAPKPTLAAAIAPLLLTVAETGAIAAYLGPYVPGGRVHAFFIAGVGSVSVAALGWAMGYFSFRAWSVANRRLRFVARASAGVLASAGAGLIVCMMAYRTSLESGKAIGEALRHLSTDSAWLGLATGLVFSATAMKARGGGNMSYPPQWRRELVDRPYREALRDVEQGEENQRHLLLEEIFVPATEIVRDTAPAAEAALAALEKEAATVIDDVLGLKQRLGDLHSAARRDHSLYCAEFEAHAPDVRLAGFTLAEPQLPDAEAILRSALANARDRLAAVRRQAAELDRILVTMRDEAMDELDAVFGGLRAQAYAAQDMTGAFDA